MQRGEPERQFLGDQHAVEIHRVAQAAVVADPDLDLVLVLVVIVGINRYIVFLFIACK